MARPKNFDREAALERAMSLFWARGFAATSTGELIEAMQIGRQSMYDSFGDKRALYLEALSRYHAQITVKRVAALHAGATALAGIEAMLLGVATEDRVVRRKGCMSVGSIIEFGTDDPDVVKVRDRSRAELVRALSDAVERAKGDGDISHDVDTSGAVRFIMTVMQGLQTDARAGAKPESLRTTARFSLAALTHR